MYYQVDESVTLFGKKLYQCTVKARKQLDGDRVRHGCAALHYTSLAVFLSA